MLHEKKYAKIEELIASGMTGLASCKKVGLSPATWYSHRAKLKAQEKKAKRHAVKSKVQVQNLPQPPSRGQQMVAIFGTPDEIRALMRGLHE